MLPPPLSARAVCSRKLAGRITMPLPSAETASTSPSGQGAGFRASQRSQTSAAARAADCSTCRLPIGVPVARPMAWAASSNDPRVDSSAASLRNPWLWRATGRLKAASAGCRCRPRAPRYALRSTLTCPNTVVSLRRCPVSAPVTSWWSASRAARRSRWPWYRRRCSCLPRVVIVSSICAWVSSAVGALSRSVTIDSSSCLERAKGRQSARARALPTRAPFRVRVHQPGTQRQTAHIPFPLTLYVKPLMTGAPPSLQQSRTH